MTPPMPGEPTPPPTRSARLVSRGRVAMIVILAVVATAIVTISVIALTGGSSSKPGSAHYTPGPLTASTPCGVLNADQAGGDSTDINNFTISANPYFANLSLDAQMHAEEDVEPHLLGECELHPAELLSAAYNIAIDEDLSATATP